MVKAKKRVEDSIQRHLVAWMKEEYPNVKVIATLNEDSRTRVDMGCDIGITDLILMRRDGEMLAVFFLELKTKTGRLSESQKDWAADYADAFASVNTHYDVAYGFSDAKEKVKSWLDSPKIFRHSVQTD